SAGSGAGGATAGFARAIGATARADGSGALAMSGSAEGLTGGPPVPRRRRSAAPGRPTPVAVAYGPVSTGGSSGSIAGRDVGAAPGAGRARPTCGIGGSIASATDGAGATGAPAFGRASTIGGSTGDGAAYSPSGRTGATATSGASRRADGAGPAAAA